MAVINVPDSGPAPVKVVDVAGEKVQVVTLESTLNDPATQTTLAAILTKIIAAPATEAKQGAGLPAALGGAGGLKVENVSALPAGTNNIGDVDLASAIPAGTNLIGKVSTDQTTHGTTDLVAADVTKLAGTAVDVNSGNKSAGTQRVVIATDQPALTTPMPVKRNTDTGRTYIALYCKDITGVTSEGMATFVKNVGGTETTGQTAYTITNGKTFRVQAITLIIKNTTTVANNLIVRLRAGGSVGTSSPIVAQVAAASVAALATVIGNSQVTYPDGIDIPGDGTVQLGISHLENVTTASITSITVTGYEY